TVNTYGNNSNQKIAANIIDGIETALMLYHNKTKLGVDVIRNYCELPTVMCYPDELCQVWSNLINNSLQAMDYKGILQIEVKLQDSKIYVNISDNGAGIPPSIQAKIFKPFFTTKSTGNGLGLDIVKNIIDKHDGMIIADSKPGQTLFSVSIPTL
ncbi:ATP-binding protein, partial [Candidatus Halobeggiatoa sp. HSG11]|nr:ATP-binding protein [Candidatus Halobeggiatoa sp. HSG11]